jgi:butyrate kinase
LTLHALRHTYYILGSYKPQQSFEVGQHKKITYLTLTSKVKIIVMSFLYSVASNIYRITAVLKVETDIITSIAAGLTKQAVILVLKYVEIFKTDVIVFISDVKMCLMSY